MTSDSTRQNEAGGSRVGAYEILGLTAAKPGSQGRIFRARCVEPVKQLNPGDIVALKEMVLPFEGERLLARAQRTVDTLRENPHSSIVRYHDFFVWQPGTFSERQCVVMEYLNGQTLADLIAKCPKGLSWETVHAFFTDCIAALCHARTLGIIHRDIKPSNIFITEPEVQVKLIDFEIARHETETQSTHTGLHGSFDYMAPEFHPRLLPYKRFSGDELSDIYSLATCLYEAMTGALPYGAERGEGHQGFFRRCEDRENRKLRLSRGKLRPIAGIRSFLEKGLAVKREDRFQSFIEMGEAFREIRREIISDDTEDYELLEWIGRGGFAEVYRACRHSDGQEVALKCLRRAQYSNQFIKEARLLASCDHPNIVRTLDFFKLPDVERYFIVMDLLREMPRASLRGRIHQARNGLDVSEVATLFCRYAEALTFLHQEQNIIHRDIKPSNLYAPEGMPEEGKLLDLGVARDLRGTVSIGPVPGTFDYMAPEFGNDKKARGSPQSDLYSLGLCLYEALTGRPALPHLPREPVSQTAAAFYERCKRAPVIDYSHPVFKDWPDLRHVVERMLAFDPRRRYSSAMDLIADLKTAAHLVPVAEGDPKTAWDGDKTALTGADDDATLATRAASIQQGRAEPATHYTEATRGAGTASTRAVLDTRAIKDLRRIRRKTRNIERLKWAAVWIIGLSILGVATYGGAYHILSRQTTALDRLDQNVSMKERARAVNDARAWQTRVRLGRYVGLPVADLTRAAEKQSNLLEAQLKEQIQIEPAKTWLSRTDNAMDVLVMPEMRTALGAESHEVLLTIAQEARREAATLKGTVQIALPSDWPEAEEAPTVILSKDGLEVERVTPAVQGKSIRVLPGPIVLQARRSGYESIEENISIDLTRPTAWTLPAPDLWKMTEWLKALEEAEENIAAEQMEEAREIFESITGVEHASMDQRTRESQVRRRIAEWEMAMEKLNEEQRRRRQNQMAAKDHLEEIREADVNVANLADVLKKLHEFSKFKREHAFENVEKLTAEYESLRDATIYTDLQTLIDSAEPTDLRVVHKALETYGESVWPGKEADSLHALIRARDTDLAAKRSEIEARKYLAAYEDLNETASMDARLQALSASARYLEDERREFSDQKRLLRDLAVQRKDVVQRIDAHMTQKDVGRAETLRMLNSALINHGEPGLDASSLDELKTDLAKALDSFIWRFVNESGQDLRVQVGERTEQSVNNGSYVEIPLSVKEYGGQVQVAIIADDQPGYEKNIITLFLERGAWSQMDATPLAPLPVQVEVERSDWFVEVGHDGRWRPLSNRVVKLIPPQEIEVRWRRDDYEPVHRVVHVVVGEDRIVHVRPPSADQWKAVSALVALREAESAFNAADYEQALRKLPNKETLHDKDNIEKRARMASFLAAWHALKDGNMEAALKAYTEAKPHDLPQWDQFREHMTDVVWRIGDPTAAKHAHACAASDQFRKIFSPNSGLALLHSQFEEFQNRTGHEQILRNMVQANVHYGPHDFALAVYCEMRVRRQLDRLARVDTSGSFPNIFGQVGVHAGRVRMLLDRWAQMDDATREQTMDLMRNWRKPSDRQAVLPIWREDEVAQSEREEALFIFTHYQNFAPNMRDKGTYIQAIQAVLNQHADNKTDMGLVELRSDRGPAR